MSSARVVVVAYDIVTPYGWGIDACWQGFLSKKTAIGTLDRFEAESFQTQNAATVQGLNPDKNESLVMQMLRPLLSKAAACIPADAFLIMATTTGEIDILEKCVLNHGAASAVDSVLSCLLNKVKHFSGITGQGMIISAACASSSAAIIHASGMIRGGECDCALVVAGDIVSEFVFAGFSSLMALDKDVARPFDKSRRGLSLGEAAGFMLLMSRTRAVKEERTVIGEIAGWGLTNDANHMTGPSRDGSGFALAIRKALRSANIPEDAVGCVAAHGTGTVYNDTMEMKAFKTVFGARSVPIYSIKGAIGHTMGAAALVEAVVGLRTLKEKVVPPTVNLRDVDVDAQEWASPELQAFDGAVSISTNAGFGGVNAALVLSRQNDSEEV